MIPTFDTVPEHWKHPAGPYRQAPANAGGRWWLINPFTSETPWLNVKRSTNGDELPKGFESLFGARPQSQDYHEAANPSLAFRTAVAVWEQTLRHFKQAGHPEWSQEEDWVNAVAAFEYWKLGYPRHYEGRYGWMTRFPDSQISDFESTTWTALNASHIVIAQYQLRLLGQGVVPTNRHPFVPPSAWPED